MIPDRCCINPADASSSAHRAPSTAHAPGTSHRRLRILTAPPTQALRLGNPMAPSSECECWTRTSLQPSQGPSTRARAAPTPSHASPGEATPVASSLRAPAAVRPSVTARSSSTASHSPPPAVVDPRTHTGRPPGGWDYPCLIRRHQAVAAISSHPPRRVGNLPVECARWSRSVGASNGVTARPPSFSRSDTSVDGAGWSADTGLVMSADWREPCRRGERQGG
jgi:hypothetical protein